MTVKKAKTESKIVSNNPKKNQLKSFITQNLISK